MAFKVLGGHGISELFYVCAALIAVGGFAVLIDEHRVPVDRAGHLTVYTSDEYNAGGWNDGFGHSITGTLFATVLPDVVSGSSDAGWGSQPVEAPRKKTIRIIDDAIPAKRPAVSAASLTQKCAEKHAAKRDTICANSADPEKCERAFDAYKHVSGQIPYENGSSKKCVSGKEAGKCSILCGKKGFKKVTSTSTGTVCVPGKTFTESGTFVCRTK